jgi:hypothetical protein
VINEATVVEDMDSETRSNNFSPGHGNKLGKMIDIKSIAEKEKFQLLELIERRCLDLTQQLYEKYLTDATIQKEIAYSLIVVARQENNIKQADSTLLRELYGVSVRNEAEFKSQVDALSTNCPNNAHNLKFDLVVREYNQEGVEIHPGQPVQRPTPAQVPGLVQAQAQRTAPVPM